MDSLYAIKKSIKNYASGGNVLIVATLLAFILANSPLADLYFSWWAQPASLQIGGFNLFSHGGESMTVMAFINDALMAIFFFAIGLEIKREVLVGELTSLKQALLPIVAAIGGMVVPVLLFMYVGRGSDFLRGSAIPMATDIAFSLGVLAMLGKRVPIALKIFLTTLAVVDDIGGILVIAIFYSSHIEVTYLLYAVGVFLALWIGGRAGVNSKMFYFILGGVVWFLFLNSGIHPTIAGVLVAFCVPAKPVLATSHFISTIRKEIVNFPQEQFADTDQSIMLSKEQLNCLKSIESASDKVISPLQDLEDTLHPVINYLIIPLFAFANAGIVLSGLELSSLFSEISLAIFLGLLLGKFLGIFLSSWIVIKLKIVSMPTHVTWKSLAAVSVLGGIGFTVSLFIANLSFGDMGPEGAVLLERAKLGIVAGSLASGIVGYFLLNLFLPKQVEEEVE
ncbi:sodium:proton antiporter [Barnesiella viscericola DSM 18177]|uniref:Na(+)/H(+) antiporter NhaA n=1 Tax=Barnesiella viscericola DSM 18177 TaxID=880074 RepID=W0ELQ9_9BACT|nr:Na+/H+ antiporter NhaA [Barnesiella viscericola]AHF11702.1 sodium:proton antiporter [Barnesiella viscericola DSM 18177]